VEGVVVRVDSPGGDPLPADLYTDACAEVSKAGKPVVVSQAGVAASGGYWLGLESDRVLATPLTMTGSIGVISAWVYDDGLAERLGVRAEGVQEGAHADLYAGLRVPFLGVRLPTRPLSEDEREGIRVRIEDRYDHFIRRVADSRGLTVSEVREVAGGRVWAGRDAVARRLVDEVGGLEAALAEARLRAGIGPDEEIRIIEYPPRSHFRLPSFAPRLPGVGAILGLFGGGEVSPAVGEAALAVEDPALDFLRMVARAPGEPLLMVPSGDLPEVEVE
jgi:protease-4